MVGAVALKDAPNAYVSISNIGLLVCNEVQLNLLNRITPHRFHTPQSFADIC